ncbi:hypothetical protein CEXT_222921 [Caerostris extrusa]|uniref:Uncharacterized protein n=1 Tax=Caerostris extrusa TaxID=172846 RepID=A0AAV4NPF5_CAEEX|nr:hypothetical protein CEXT_222921 [Caerostris extrusa]
MFANRTLNSRTWNLGRMKRSREVIFSKDRPQGRPYTILALNLAAVDMVGYLGGHAFRLTEGPFIKDVTLLFNKSTLWHRRLGKQDFGVDSLRC